MGDDDRPDTLEVSQLVRDVADWLVAATADVADPSLYAGLAGIALALVEAHHDLGDERYATAAERAGDVVEEAVEGVDDASLYFGLTGFAATLRALGRDAAADRALHRARTVQRPDGRWGPMFEVLKGNAGTGLGALHAGDLDLAVDAVTPYLDSADTTPFGVNWAIRPTPSRSHHVAHGTLGIVLALATVGEAAGRRDLVDLAVAGAGDVVSRNDAGPEGFLVPHSDPQHLPGSVERYSLGWCNGPAGDAQVFRLLARVTEDPTWTDLEDRCLHTIDTSGLPRRVRPGFWDNHGRCCGTAGVLALACDHVVERGDDLRLASRLVRDLVHHAVTDEDGARWSNREHRSWLPDLPPEPGWAMGNAGILRELLRYLRITGGADAHYAVAWPDHPPT